MTDGDLDVTQRRYMPVSRTPAAFGHVQVASFGHGTETGSTERVESGRDVFEDKRDAARQWDPGDKAGRLDEEGAGAHPHRIDFVVDPARVLRILLRMIAVLVTLSTATQAMRLYLPDYPLRDSIADLFYVDFEQSVPTLYSSVMLLANALLFGVISHAHRRGGQPYVRHWGVLAILFLLLALDEFAVLHEQAIRPFRALLDVDGGPLWWAWVVPAALAVAILGIALSRFLLHLPRPTRRRLLASGILFVGGAIGIEMVGAAYGSAHGLDNFAYVLIATVEESLEMLGTALLINVLLAYVPVGLPRAAWRLRVAPPG